MSILSSLMHGKPKHLPNEIHNKDETHDTIVYEKDRLLTALAQKQKSAMQAGAVHPTLFYSDNATEVVNGRNYEDDREVKSKLEQKEEFPLG